MQNFGMSMLWFWLAYLIVTIIGIGHTFLYEDDDFSVAKRSIHPLNGAAVPPAPLFPVQ